MGDSTLNTNPLTAPDWGLWSCIPTAGLDEAVALSLNVNPLFAPMLWNMFNNQDSSEHDEGTAGFAKRLVVARNNIQPLGTLPVIGMDETPPRCRVRLADFAEFASRLGWSMPPEFPYAQAGLRSKASTSSSGDEEGNNIGEKIRARNIELKQKHHPAVIKALTKEFNRSESTIKKHLYRKKKAKI